jgi:acyl-CoA synthetase (NDP forming)
VRSKAAEMKWRLPARHSGRGVAIICQHGSVADSVLCNDRSLPIGFFICVDAELRPSLGEMIDRLAKDERVSAFGLCLQDGAELAQLAGAIERARSFGKPMAMMTTRPADPVRLAAQTHSSRLGPPLGLDELLDSFCTQSGIARCRSLASFCETLKVFHTGGPLPGGRVLLAGASGGAMAMTADAARDSKLQFPPIPENQSAELQYLLTDKVAIANPLDFHSHNWFDSASMLAMFSCLHQSGFDATALVIDCPPTDRADATTYLNVIDQFIATYPGPPRRAVVLSSLPESLPTSIREKCLAARIAPLQGQKEGLEALDLARQVGEAWQNGSCVTLRIPARPSSAIAGTVRSSECSFAQLGIAGIRSLPEEAISDSVAEMFINIKVDRQFGQVLVVGSAGALGELLPEHAVLFSPFTQQSVESALERLKVWQLLTGFRGRPAGDIAAVIDVVLACCRFALSAVDSLIDLEINPLRVRPAGKGVTAVECRICEIEQCPQ